MDNFTVYGKPKTNILILFSTTCDESLKMEKEVKIRPCLNVDSVVQDLMKINHFDEFHGFLTDFISKLHLKHFWHMFAPNKFKPKTQLLKAINNHPKGFEDEYLRSGKRAFDCPVLSHAYSFSQQPILWSEMIDYANLNDKEIQSMEWYKLYGLHDGICFTIHEPGNIYAVLTFILDEKKALSSKEIATVKNYITLMASFIHNKYSSLADDSIPNNVRSKLTPRESECLIWASRGKTIWETAKILNLSESTVREYLCNTMKKLDATTKVAAVSKAILGNEIPYTELVVS